MKYTVSMRIDSRVDVTVDADSFDEAFCRAQNSLYDMGKAEIVDDVPVCATDENGRTEDYNG